MTHGQWLQLREGDVVVDHAAKGEPRRVVHSVQHADVRKGGRRHTRTVITVGGLRSAAHITIFEYDDWLAGVGKRFSLVPPA